MKKQPEITERTKAILTDAFWQLYCQKDIRNISVKEITDKGGFNRSTFYQYFADVYDVLNKIEDSLIDCVIGHVRESMKLEIDDNILKGLAQIYDLKGTYLSVLLGKNGDPLFADKLKSALRSLGKLGGAKYDNRTEIMFEFAISGILAAVTSWYIQGKTIPAEEMVCMVRSILIHGVADKMMIR